MNFQRTQRGGVTIAEIDPFFFDILGGIPEAAGSDHPAVQERLFSSPTEGEDPELEQDWSEYVEPDLRKHFEEGMSRVEEDLARMSVDSESGYGMLEIPAEHIDAWLLGLNQARLALSAQHGFTEEEMEQKARLKMGKRAMALFQVNFYGILQEALLSGASGDDQ
jgi:hypothetical protein